MADGGACPPVASALLDPPISELCVRKLMAPSPPTFLLLQLSYTLGRWINASAIRGTCFVKKYRETLLHAFTKLLAQWFSPAEFEQFIRNSSRRERKRERRIRCVKISWRNFCFLFAVISFFIDRGNILTKIAGEFLFFLITTIGEVMKIRIRS